MDRDECDLLIVGGGINGVAIAADLAGRGLQVILCEKSDLASGTSSVSSGLIHGGLRYLEQGEFRLVREALHERGGLLKRAPHLVQPLPFIFPVQAQLRSKLWVRLGLTFYDFLSGNDLPHSASVSLDDTDYGAPLKQKQVPAFRYYDAWTQDARLVMANAQLAKAEGAQILTYHKVNSAVRHGGRWHVEVFDEQHQRPKTINARALVYAVGPWVPEIKLPLKEQPSLRLSQGSHLVVPRIYAGDHAYLFENPDQRIVFVLPLTAEYQLIGTTDVEFNGDPGDAKITDTEYDYLLKTINHYFLKPLDRSMIYSTTTGVRPLLNQGGVIAKISRDYTFYVEDQAGQAPVLVVLGGKLTTHRNLAERVGGRLAMYFPNLKASRTQQQFLAGGDLKGLTPKEYFQAMCTDYPKIPKQLIQRYVDTYGSGAKDLLSDIKDTRDLGEMIVADITECELQYLRNNEWLFRAEDTSHRRGKWRLSLNANEIERLNHFF